MWMGGFVPLGYEPKDRSLVVNEAEAETVRTLFSLYLKLRNVRRVKEEADRLNLRSKQHGNGDGRSYGGVSFSRGAIYKILSNPIYVGEIVHRGERHPGSHRAIIDPETWDAVQRQLAANAARHKGQAGMPSSSLLAGLIFDHGGEPLTPTHASKGGRRYRYYVSRSLLDGSAAERGKASDSGPSWRLPAREIENLVVTAIADLLADSATLVERLGLAQLDTPKLHHVLLQARAQAERLRASNPEPLGVVRRFVQRVEVGPDAVAMHLDTGELLHWIHGGTAQASRPESALVLTVPVKLKRRGSELKLVLVDRPEPVRPDSSLIRALARGFGWYEELRTGAAPSLGAIAERENVSPNLVRRTIDLAFLPTDLVEEIVAGRQPVELTSESMRQAYPLPLRWKGQKDVLGFEMG